MLIGYFGGIEEVDRESERRYGRTVFNLSSLGRLLQILLREYPLVAFGSPWWRSGRVKVYWEFTLG